MHQNSKTDFFQFENIIVVSPHDLNLSIHFLTNIKLSEAIRFSH